ncbi:Putative BEN domain-containing protein B1 [Frankliniella fusca]|uniref:BEN domain-containing protein B1 n=1 Tax=Frankliniella fusca TaxID=407009 RepID=A0AAE1HVQ2_9NEOP|nr:Putative BEN domain-containing protein B1 [Frankliniella fusca]
MRRRPTRLFALVFLENPASVEIVGHDEFLEPGSMAEQTVRRMSRPSWDAEDCTILRTGKKTELSKLKVKADRTIHDEAIEGEIYVGTRHHELKQLKKEAATARAENINEVATQLHANGPDALIAKVPKVDRRPKKRPANELQALRTQLEALPCLTEKPGDVEVSPGTKVYYNAAKLCLVGDLSNRNPQKAATELLARLLPMEVLTHSALSLSGRGDTVAIPFDVTAAVRGFVQSYLELKTPWPEFGVTIRNFLNRKKKVKKVANEESVVQHRGLQGGQQVHGQHQVPQHHHSDVEVDLEVHSVQHEHQGGQDLQHHAGDVQRHAHAQYHGPLQHHGDMQVNAAHNDNQGLQHHYGGGALHQGADLYQQQPGGRYPVLFGPDRAPAPGSIIPTWGQLSEDFEPLAPGTTGTTPPRFVTL